MRWMLFAKLGIGMAFALLINCIPESELDGTDGGTTTSAEGGTGATGGALVPIGADALCTRLIGTCGQTSSTQEQCVATFFPLRVSAACSNALPSATCADLTSTTSAISTLCFPTCTVGTAPVCNGDGTVTLCTDSGNTHRNDCQISCQSDGYTSWTGVCGTTYAGQLSEQPQCWCQ